MLVIIVLNFSGIQDFFELFIMILIYREHKLWDLQMPYNGSDYFHYRWPYNGISSVAQCTPNEEWELALGVRPYEEEKVIVHEAYCLP